MTPAERCDEIVRLIDEALVDVVVSCEHSSNLGARPVPGRTGDLSVSSSSQADREGVRARHLLANRAPQGWVW